MYILDIGLAILMGSIGVAIVVAVYMSFKDKEE